MIIELTNFFNWKGSLLSPGQVLSDLPDGLANNLINAGNAREYNPKQQEIAIESKTIEVQNEPKIQSDKPKNTTPRANAKARGNIGKPKTNRNKQV